MKKYEGNTKPWLCELAPPDPWRERYAYADKMPSFSKSQSLYRGGEPKAPGNKKYGEIWGSMKKYEGICRKYEGKMKNMKEYVENMKKYEGNTKLWLRELAPLFRDVSVTPTRTQFLGWPSVPKGKVGLPPKVQYARALEEENPWVDPSFWKDGVHNTASAKRLNVLEPFEKHILQFWCL
mgnify:CR=1 FL=1